jgi:hypothetical protein
MQFTKLNWRKYNNEYRADVKLKSIFGIRFICGILYEFEPKKYFYKWIINGKKYGDYFEYQSESLEDAKQKCEQEYIKICNNIINVLCDKINS